jgi:hypothetical protein
MFKISWYRVWPSLVAITLVMGWTAASGQGGEADVKEAGGVKVEHVATGELICPPMVIEGRLEKPVALFIQRQQPEFKTARFERDFWDDILRPVDVEGLKRAGQDKPYDYVKNPLLWMAVATAATSGAAAGYQAYNEEWAQVKVYAFTAAGAAAAGAALVMIDRSLSRGR